VRRGEIWRYQGLGRHRLVLVVSDDELNGRGEPIVVDITETGPEGPLALLTVRVGEWGFARCRRLTFADADRFTEQVAQMSAEVMDQVDVGLRVVLSL
jgi:mRNA-degrading endonuclease toxin of MazEF toxin-antitoxin module